MLFFDHNSLDHNCLSYPSQSWYRDAALYPASVCQISRQSDMAFAFYSSFCKCAKRGSKIRRKTKKLSQFLKSHISGTLEAISLKLFFFNPGLMDCPFLPPPAQIASAGQLNKIKQTNGIPQPLSPLTVESWCKHQWKTVPHEYTELPSAITKSSGNNAANPEPQNNHLPTFGQKRSKSLIKNNSLMG